MAVCQYTGRVSVRPIAGCVTKPVAEHMLALLGHTDRTLSSSLSLLGKVMPDLPSGTVTLLFTNIQGSTSSTPACRRSYRPAHGTLRTEEASVTPATVAE